MRNLLKGVLVLSLAIAVTSCGLTGGNKDQLIAKSWELDVKAMTASDKKEKDDIGSQIGNLLSGLMSKAIRFEFKSDGSFNAKSPFFGTNKEQIGEWKISGNDLILTVKGEDKTIKIVKLTENQLVLGGNEKGQDFYLKPGSE